MSAYVIATALAAALNIYASVNDFVRPHSLLKNMRRLGVPESSLPILGIVKAAGAIGLLIGIRLPMIGTLAATGLTVFFIGAIITHLRARDYSLGNGVPVIFLAGVLAALILRIHARN